MVTLRLAASEEAEGADVGVIRIVDRKDGTRKHISPLWIMPSYRGRVYAREAIRAAEDICGTHQ